MQPEQHPASRGRRWVAMLLGTAALALLVGLGTWQVERLRWKEALIAMIEERVAAEPRPLSDIEAEFAARGDVDYWPVRAEGVFLHDGERHFLATHQGRTGFHVYTPLRLEDGRVVFVNRGFVPYDLKQPATRPAGQVAGSAVVAGLARNPLTAKPSLLIPDNDPGANIFYWKDIVAMSQTAGLPSGTGVLPFFIDADASPVPGGWPVGGVTWISLPNNHLQYAVTWYGLAAALLGVMVMSLRRRRTGA